jgi:fructokinase
MRKIYAIGETLYDIIFKEGQPQAGKPGGSMLNSAISLGRIELPVSLISEYGNDDVGKIIDKFLNSNGVATSFVNHFSKGKTALAIAVLNEKNDASYTFYKDYPSRRLEMEFPSVQKDDIILCGSVYAITPEIRKKFVRLIKASKRNGGIVIYDPNFRMAHAAELNELKPLIVENIQLAGIVRGSDEDFYNIFGAGSPDEAWESVKEYCNCLVYTANANGVFVRTTGFSGKFPVKEITPVSTIGAGDNFNAGMITSIFMNNYHSEQLGDLTEREWGKIISTAVDFATEVCLSYDNYVSREFAAKFK